MVKGIALNNSDEGMYATVYVDSTVIEIKMWKEIDVPNEIRKRGYNISDSEEYLMNETIHTYRKQHI